MQVVKKIEAKLMPSTLQLAYANVQEQILDFSVLKFADGSLRVKLETEEELIQQATLYIEAYLQNLDDLMVVAQMKEIVCRKSLNLISSVLTITSPLYSRYDRVMLKDKTDSFGASVFGGMVSQLNFGAVRYVDCHSDVLVNRTRNAHDLAQHNVLKHMRSKFPELEDLPTIAPDKGAVHKNASPSVIFEKVRDVNNGKILGVEKVFAVEHTYRDRHYLVVDDLCEGGRTFLEVADCFKREHAENAILNLFVTHGLFTNNAVPKLLEKYFTIYVYIMKASVYHALTEDEKSRINVMYLVDDTN